MKVCVVGAGGREHALAHVLARTAEVVVTPGNPGIPWSTSTPVEEVEADLVVIGPEAPLVDGLADRLRARGRRVFGPGADGARLEGSKTWMKELLDDAGVPTARHRSFGPDELAAALVYLERFEVVVVKTDGLAAGKGVLVTADRAEAAEDVRAKLSGEAFGDAGLRVVIEEGMTGPEVSLMCLCDGRRVVPLAPAQDHKRIFDGDAGPNTGGMGAYSPVPFLDAATVSQVVDTMVEPTLGALRRRGIDYRGVLYTGLMLTPDGPRMLEYNARFGDPEAQVVLPRVSGDLAEVLAAAADGDLRGDVAFSGDAAVTVVAATAGYPGVVRSGDPIVGLDRLEGRAGVTVFCAGVGAGGRPGELVTAGGRVLAVTALAGDLTEARARAYAAVAEVSWPGMQIRTDIGALAIR